MAAPHNPGWQEQETDAGDEEEDGSGRPNPVTRQKWARIHRARSGSGIARRPSG